jgi:membrane-bound serine protease (ClpP class)
MKRLFRLLVPILFFAAALSGQTPLEKPAAPAAPGGGVLTVALRGEIAPAQLETLRQAIAQAERERASGLIVEIDSERGRVDVAMDEMDALMATSVPTAAFVNPKAISAGAMIAFATKKIYMHPSASIGANAVIAGAGEDLDPSAGKKATNMVVGKIREVAKANGHAEDVAEAMVRVEAELKRGDKVLDGKDTLLTMKANAAAESYFGHPILAAGIANNVAHVAQLAGFSGVVRDFASGATTVAATNPGTVAPGPGNAAGPIFVIPLNESVGDGEVSPTQFMFLRRALKEAQKENASAVILDISTFGGRVDAALDEMDALLATKIPTIAYVNTKAISAGSMVSLAAKRIYMHPSAVIGASAVVSGDGEDLNKTMAAKATSFVVAKARGAARANGHAEDVAEAFIKIESKVIRDGKMLDDDKTLLSLNASDATKEYDGQPLLAAGTASSIEELVRVAGLSTSATVKHFQPSGFETLAFWITMLAPLLLLGGMIGAFIEMKMPGFGIPGICSLICFALFFGGHYVAGLAGMESMVVFVIGLVLVIVEIFAMPGTVVPGIIGVLLMLGSLVWAMVDHLPASGGGWSFPSAAELERPMLNLILAVAGTAVAAAFLAKILPKTALYGRLVLASASPTGPGVSVPVVNLSVKAGDTGTATTTLRPAGKASIGGETHDVISAGDFIPVGSRIRVTSVDGMRVVVEPAG